MAKRKLIEAAIGSRPSKILKTAGILAADPLLRKVVGKAAARASPYIGAAVSAYRGYRFLR